MSENTPAFPPEPEQPAAQQPAQPEVTAPEPAQTQAQPTALTTPLPDAQPTNQTQPTTPYPSAPQPAPRYGEYAPGYQQPAQSAQPAQPAQPTQPVSQPTQPQPTQASQGGQGGGSVPPTFTHTPDPEAEKPQKRRGRGASFIAGIAAAALIGGGVGAGTGIWAYSQNGGGGTTQVVQGSTQQLTINDTDSVNQVSAAAAKAYPSVVTIEASSGSTAGSGSGVVLDTEGHVVTNAHVVTLDGETNSATLTVTTSDGTTYNASVVAYDAYSDLAVIQIENPGELTPATFADSDKLNVGDTAVAIGAPLGLSGTVTDGIVSALNRSITVASSEVPDSSSGDTGSKLPDDYWGFDFPGGGGQSQQQQQQSTSASSAIYLSVIQTDAAINPGNSGGALVNSEGEVIGINVAIATASSDSSESSSSGSIGVGFSIPSNFVQRVTKSLIEDGKVTHGFLGVSIQDSEESTSGATISEVVSGGAAEEAGLKVGDLVTAVDGVAVKSPDDLTALVRKYAAGTKVQITYQRNGKTQAVDVTLGEMES